MYTTETESKQSKGFLVNNYQNGLVGYFPVILVVGFLFLSRQEESSYRGKDTEGKKMKTHGAEWGAQEDSGRVSMGTSTLTQSVWHRCHTEELRMEMMTIGMPKRKKCLNSRPARLFCEERGLREQLCDCLSGTFCFAF